MKLLEAKSLYKSFGNIDAVSNISISLNVGEVIGFLGPNGAGKSTTMKMLTGFLEADFGSIEIKKLDLSKNPINAKSIIGYLPEGAPSYSDMTVRTFLYFVERISTSTINYQSENFTSDKPRSHSMTRPKSIS